MEYTIHIVKHDDSFNRLAHRYNSSAKEIIETHNQTANPQKPLTIASTIYSGDKIHIPIKNKAADGTAYALFEFFDDEVVEVKTLVNYYGITAKELNDYNGKVIVSPIINTPVKVPIKIYTSADNKTNIESDNTSSLGICTPTPCEDGILIIQVAGLNHPKGQRIAIEDKNNKELSSTDTAAKTTQNALKKLDIETIKEDQQRLTCHLHKWDWDNKQTKDQRNLSLIINKEKGGEIRLPFASDIGETPRQNDAQLIQIVPIVPFTMVKSTALYNVGVPALARPGYLYIYQDYTQEGETKSRLWREIQIKQDEKTGKTTYHDIHLEQHYNKETDQYSGDIREAVGIALEEIWLPTSWQPKNACFKNRIAYVIEYSEVQLSAARLNYLAKNDNHVANPVTNPGKNNYFEMGFAMDVVREIFQAQSGKDITLDIENLLRISNNYDDAAAKQYGSPTVRLYNQLKRSPFPIKALPPHRPREEQLEWLLEYPAAYLYNMQGDYLVNSYEAAKTRHQEEVLEGQYRSAQGLEISAWQSVILDNVAKEYDAQITKLQQEIDIAQRVQQLFSPKPVRQSVRVPYAAPTDDQDNAQSDQQNPNYIWGAMQNVADGFKSISQQLYQSRIDDLEKQKQQFEQKKAINEKLKAFWQEKSKPENTLQSWQERDIFGCLIEDPHYQVRHLVKRLTDCHQTMTAALEEIPQFEHYNSAILVQKTLSPVLINGQVNPLITERIPEFLKNGTQRIAKHSGSVQRHLLKQHYFNLQFALCKLLQQSDTQKTWADHLSLNEQFSYSAAYLNAAQTFSLLGNITEQIDPLHSPEEIVDEGFNSTVLYQSKDAQEYLLEVSQNKDNPYHPMLWMEIKDEEPRLKVPYQCPANLPASDGSGKCRLDVVAQLASYDKIPEKNNITLDTDFLNKMMTEGDAQKMVEDYAKAGLNALNSIGGNLITSIRTNYIQLRAVQGQIIQSRQLETAANRASTAANQAANTAFNNLTGAGETAQIRLHGVDTDLFNIQNFDMLRTLNGNNPLGLAHLGALQELALQETPAVRGRKPDRSNTIERIDTSSGQTLTIERNPTTGEILTINGRPLAEVNKRVILFEGNYDQFTGRNVFGNILNNEGGIVNAVNDIEMGELSGTTSSTNANQAGLTEPPQRFIAVVYDANTPLDQLITAEHNARSQAIQAANNVFNIHNAEAAARIVLHRQRQFFLNKYAEGLDRLNNGVYRFVASPHFAGGMLGFAAIGLVNEVGSYGDTINQKGWLRANFGLASALSDMAFAAEELTFRLSRRQSIMSVWRMSIAEMNTAGIAWRFNSALARAGFSSASYLGLFQSAFALVAVVSNAIDLRYAYLENDNDGTKAALWIGLAGAGLGVIGPIVGGGLLLGPIGWAGLILIGVSIFLLYKFSTPPLETWLDNGPFGNNQAANLSHLRDPVEGYYRLLNLFANIQISVKDNPDYKLSPNVPADTKEWIMQSAQQIIEVTSLIPGLITGATSIEPIIKWKDTPKTLMASNMAAYDPSYKSPATLGKMPLENGLRVYVEKPASHLYEWAIRAQFKVVTDGHLMVFPGKANIKSAGDPYDPNKYRHANPNFWLRGLDFWADEHNNKPAS